MTRDPDLQKIKITSNKEDKSRLHVRRNFCPFSLMRQYMDLRGGYEDEHEQFFVFRDLSPVKPFHF